MMKMATGEGFPPLAGCRNGSRMDFGGYGGFWRRNSQSIVCSGSFRVREYIWVQEVRRWSFGGPMRQGRALGGAPHPREHLPWILTWGQVHPVAFLPKITSLVDFVPFSTPFDIPFL